MQIIPLATRLGAEVRGIDAGAVLDADSQAALRAALDRHLTLLIRDQDLMPIDRHIRLGEVFGPQRTEDQIRRTIGKREYQPDDVPNSITVVSNIKVGGQAIGVLGDGECFWHTDSCYFDNPPSVCVLHAIQIPPDGGNTSFLDMIDALETLPGDLRQAIEGRRISHSHMYTSAGDVRPEVEGKTDVAAQPGPEHPIVRTGDGDGRQCLFLGRRLGASIVGLPAEESEELLDALWAHTINDKRVWSHKWDVGDVVIWDNRTTMHHRDPFDPNAQRRLHKVQVAWEPAV